MLEQPRRALSTITCSVPTSGAPLGPQLSIKSPQTLSSPQVPSQLYFIIVLLTETRRRVQSAVQSSRLRARLPAKAKHSRCSPEGKSSEEKQVASPASLLPPTFNCTFLPRSVCPQRCPSPGDLLQVHVAHHQHPAGQADLRHARGKGEHTPHPALPRIAEPFTPVLPSSCHWRSHAASSRTGTAPMSSSSAPRWRWRALLRPTGAWRSSRPSARWSSRPSSKWVSEGGSSPLSPLGGGIPPPHTARATPAAPP